MVNCSKRREMPLSFPAKQAGRSATSIWLTIGLSGCFGIARMSRGAERLQWEQKPGYRLAPLNVPKSGHSGFTLLTPEQTNLRFTNYLSHAHAQTTQNLLNGAGLAAGDFDGDGLCDLYFCNLEGANALYRN